MMTIDIFSDIVCPWCFIGKRRLERALGQVDDSVKAQVIWRPFQLNPMMPQGGMNRIEYLKAKFGSLETFRTIETQLLSAGEAEEISFAFGKIARTPNTFLAHRLIWLAGRHGCQDAVVESLFRGYFVEAADIGSPLTLVPLAERAGLQTESFFHGDEGTAEVKQEEAVGRSLGIRAVPYFVLNQADGIAGAQPVDVFVSAIEKIQARGTVGR
jgi:predicted DsbA family dithiol-disulfide isomerase